MDGIGRPFERHAAAYVEIGLKGTIEDTIKSISIYVYLYIYIGRNIYVDR